MVDWIFEIAQASPVAHAVGLLALVCATGMAIGSVKFKGIGLGSAGVLFTGILVAQFTDPISKPTLDFVKEFGLVLFVFTIGLQLGPGFLASLRLDGLHLNALAAMLILLSGVLTIALAWLCGLEPQAVGGLFAGASTNSPALGAAQQTLSTMPNTTAEQLAIPALACAVAYPVAIVGLLVTLLILKRCFRIDAVREAEELATALHPVRKSLARRMLVVANPELDGETLENIYARAGENVVISRIRSADSQDIRTAHRTTKLRVGDVVLSVGTESQLDQFQELVGRPSEEDFLRADLPIAYRRIVVTDKRALGRTLGEIDLERKFEVEPTRLARGDVELTAVPGLRLQFGDTLQIVGTAEQLDRTAAFLGNSLKSLNETQFIPLFAGIFLGVLVGSVPIAMPGLSVPLKIGLAGGPLVVALLLGRLGHLGGLVWYLPQSANHAFREFGVALFFAALGLAAGDQFFAAAVSPAGALWAVTGAAITVIPLLVIGMWARMVHRMNFATLGGLLSGAMTNPPALTFVSDLCKSESPMRAYATVYPLATLMRILVAQILAVLFCG